MAGIRLALETTAIDADVHSRRVSVAHGGAVETVAYDELLVATGAKPVQPPIPGVDLDGVHSLHTMADSFAVHSQLVTAQRVVIIGAGYIGCELADAFSRRQLDVTLVEALPEVLATVDPTFGRMVRDELVGNGVRVLTGMAVAGIHRDGPGLTVGVDGDIQLPVDLVLIAVGVTPNAALGHRLGIPAGVRGDSWSTGAWRRPCPTSGPPAMRGRGFR